jgi:hypothetical protein
MTLNTVGMNVVIQVSTKVLYNNYFSSIKDVMWDNGEDTVASKILDFDFIEGCINGKMTKIRRGFMDGNTTLVLWKEAVRIIETALKGNASIEIRVFHDDRLIGSVVDSEITI